MKLDYQSNLTRGSQPPYVEGKALWVPSGCRLAPLCLECGRQEALVENTYTLKNTTKFVRFYLCAAHDVHYRRFERAWAAGVFILFAAYFGFLISLAFNKHPMWGFAGGFVLCLMSLIVRLIASGTRPFRVGWSKRI